MSLTLLVSQEKWQEFDQAWSELMKSSGPVEELIGALRLVGEKKRLARCLPSVKEHAAKLAKDGRSAEAARLLGTAVQGGAAPGEILPSLLEQATAAWGSESWWPKYVEISGLATDAPDGRQAWAAFERLITFQKGSLIYHAGGWGVGEIEEVVNEPAEVVVRFQNGRRDRFPLAAAMDIFDPLPEEDLRARHFRDPDALRKAVRTEPLDVLKAVLLRHQGRASNVGIKNALMQIGIDGSSFSGWWRRARKLAETSPWFKVMGSATKGEVQLLATESDPLQDMRQQMLNQPTLNHVLTRVRDQLASAKDPQMRLVLLEALELRVRESKTGNPTALAAWMLLRDERKEPQEELLAHLRNVAATPPPADAIDAPALWALFATLPGAREQERCVQALQDLYADDWKTEAARNLQHAPGGMARALVEALYAEGLKEDLARHYSELLARPMRAPDVLIALARLAEAGKLEGEFGTPLARAQSLLSLATYLFVNRRQDATLMRAQTRLSEFLTKGKEPLIERLLEGADNDALMSLQRTLQRGVEEEIDSVMTDVFARILPVDTGSGLQGHRFWEDGRIWSTKAGLEKRRAELRHIMEVKIPANTDAIGKAAAMGDLSENSEWEAAIEDQRNLTTRASEMEIELRNVELIESAILPENVVSPGTTVRYTQQGRATVQEITVLGPWDTDQGEHVVSYRAPLAAGLLGSRPGDEVQVTLPTGPITLKIDSVRTLHFD
ncbi:MAG: GreA/GreB family elongation factor [Planctomycetes bacterium]|nr:GreA/GreB family elongation factor [Planctomycetota bacterium]